jgi:dienelactone hydrolase
MLSAALCDHSQPTGTVITQSFVSQGRGISYEVFGSGPASATVIVHGASGPAVMGYRTQAAFFASHGYRTLLVHYYDASRSRTPNTVNYTAWANAVSALVAILRRFDPQQSIYVVGYSLGASVALAAGSQQLPVSAVAEWYGSLPGAFFHSLKGMPPLLILHGQHDQNVQVTNARQLIRLCSMAGFTCASHIYPDEGHGFTGKALADADARTLAFFAAHP